MTKPGMTESGDRVHPLMNSLDMVDGGLTKREYFAAMALSGLASAYVASRPDEFYIADEAVKIADALILGLNLERNKE